MAEESIAPQSSLDQSSSVSGVAVAAEDASEKTQVSNEMHAAFPAERLVVRSAATYGAGRHQKDFRPKSKTQARNVTRVRVRS